MPTTQYKRSWKRYNALTLVNQLAVIDWDYDISNVQHYWNKFENDLIRVVDKIAPMTEFTNNNTADTSVDSQIKPLVNKKDGS